MADSIPVDPGRPRDPPLSREVAAIRLPLPPLAEIARLLAEARDVREVLQRVAEGALEISGARSAYVEQVISASGTVEVVAAAGNRHPPLGTRVPYPGSLTEEMLESPGPVPLTELDRIGEAIAPYLTDWCDGCSALVVPLFADREVLGTLVLLRRPGDTPYSLGEVAEARLLGDLASASLRRVLLLEQTRREREEKTALLESTGEGIYGIDLEGRCTFINRSGARLVGYRPEELLGRNMHDVIHARHADGSPYPEEECPIFRAFRAGVGVRVDADVLWRSDGSSFPAEYASYPLIQEGKQRGAVVTFADITERRRGEAERESLLAAERAAREEAERALRARDEVLGIVSHDLRNPLNTVLMGASTLLEIPLPEEQREKQLRIIHRSAERMNRLIQDLLDVVRIEAGGFAVDAQPVDPALMVRESYESFRPLAEERALTLECALGDGLPRVRADRDRILQVLSNLIGNALKFTEPGGRVAVGAEAGEGEVVVFVSDTGSGIATEDLPHLFDAYWQARKTAHLGAGLGLSISRGIIDAHGGRVSVESRVGAGTTFRFTLPLAG